MAGAALIARKPHQSQRLGHRQLITIPAFGSATAESHVLADIEMGKRRGPLDTVHGRGTADRRDISPVPQHPAFVRREASDDPGKSSCRSRTAPGHDELALLDREVDVVGAATAP
jgi:hypothetical protein